MRTRGGSGYTIVEILRPAPGFWKIHCDDAETPYVVAAFVHSPMRVELRLPPILKRRRPVIDVRVTFEDRHLSPPQWSGWSRRAPLLALDTQPGVVERRHLDWTDGLPKQLVGHVEAAREVSALAWTADAVPRLPEGFSRVRLNVDGTLAGGAPFRRVALRTVFVR
jgi:hypothetical protein